MSVSKQAIDSLNKKFNNAIITDDKNWDFVPSGISQFDSFVGGIPLGTIMELYGPEGAGKTTTTLTIMSAISRSTGKSCGFIDFEHVLSLDYARKLYDLRLNDNFILAQPDTMEDGFDIIDYLLDKGIGALAVDSVAAMCPVAEFSEESLADGHMGDKARQFGKALRKLAGKLRRKQVPAIFINQVREKIGVQFGNPETTPGGRALKFYSAIRARVSQVKPTISMHGFEGSEFVKMALIKNKVTGRKTDFGYLITPGIGIEREEELLRCAVAHSVIELKGKSHYYFKGKKIGGSKSIAINVLRKENNAKAVLKEIMDS